MTKMSFYRLALATVTATAALAIPPLAHAADPSSDFPAGFGIQPINTGLMDTSSPAISDFAVLPDDSIIAVNPMGILNWASEDGSEWHLIGDLAATSPDTTKKSIALAADFLTSHTIYVANAEFTNLAKVVLAVDANNHPVHISGASSPLYSSREVTSVNTAPDGTIFVGTKSQWVDPPTGPTTPTYDSPEAGGQILHLNTDGSAVSSNPFYDAAAPNSNKSKIYAYGFHLPTSLSYDATLGTVTAADTYLDHSEVNSVQPGKSYGWPCWSGTTPIANTPANCASFANTAPILYPSNSANLVGPVRYTCTTYPTRYRNLAFLSSKDSYGLRTAQLSNGVTTISRFGDTIGDIIDVHSAPANGDIVFNDGTPTLKRLIYTGKSGPEAKATVLFDQTTKTAYFDASIKQSALWRYYANDLT
jgi:glucose/arabinose dehydrogenase